MSKINKSFFITATGTGIGKTFVTCALCHQLKKAGTDIFAIKPIISGWEDSDTDTHKIITSLGLSASQQNIEKISPWRFKAPLSPNIAAEKEKRTIDFAELVGFCQKSQAENQALLIEGVGGLMVPINNDKTVLDLIKQLKIPAILVAGTYLGSINHTLLSINAMNQAGIKIQAIILSQSSECAGLDETYRTLRNFTDTKIITIPYLEESINIWDKVPDITNIMEN